MQYVISISLPSISSVHNRRKLCSAKIATAANSGAAHGCTKLSTHEGPLKNERSCITSEPQQPHNIHVFSPQAQTNEHEKKRETTHKQTDRQTYRQKYKQRTILYT